VVHSARSFKSCSVVNEIKPAAAIVHDHVAEAEAVLAQTGEPAD
jgi:hypothetical protein